MFLTLPKPFIKDIPRLAEVPGGWRSLKISMNLARATESAHSNAQDREHSDWLILLSRPIRFPPKPDYLITLVCLDS